PNDVRAAGIEAIRRYQDKHRLAYQTEAPVNWCPALGTVLANEEVIDGKSERGGHPVVRIFLRQWMLRITAYADRLQDDLASVNWPRAVTLPERNWSCTTAGDQDAAAELDRKERRRRSRFLHRRTRDQQRRRWCALCRGVHRLEIGACETRLPARSRRRRPSHLHHASRHAVRRHLHGTGTRAPVCRSPHHFRTEIRGRRVSAAGLDEK